MMKKWIFAILIAFAGCCAEARCQIPLCENGRCDTRHIVREFVPSTHVVRDFIPPIVAVVAAPIRVVRTIAQAPIATVIPKQASGPQWTNHDGLSARNHIAHVHGTNTDGMTNAEVLQSRNDYHNKYGAGHPVRESTSNCPGGVCPQQSTYVVPRFRIFGRLR